MTALRTFFAWFVFAFCLATASTAGAYHTQFVK
jgi:hypothetical protein